MFLETIPPYILELEEQEQHLQNQACKESPLSPGCQSALLLALGTGSRHPKDQGGAHHGRTMGGDHWYQAPSPVEAKAGAVTPSGWHLQWDHL